MIHSIVKRVTIKHSLVQWFPTPAPETAGAPWKFRANEGEWHGLVVFISACHSKAQRFKSSSVKFVGLILCFCKKWLLCEKIVNKKIHPFGMATFKKSLGPMLPMLLSRFFFVIMHKFSKKIAIIFTTFLHFLV